MHEYGVTASIVELVIKRMPAGYIRAAEIYVRVGKLSGIFPECVSLYFDVLTEGTVCEGSKLIINPADGRDFFIESVVYEHDGNDKGGHNGIRLRKKRGGLGCFKQSSDGARRVLRKHSWQSRRG